MSDDIVPTPSAPPKRRRLLSDVSRVGLASGGAAAAAVSSASALGVGLAALPAIEVLIARIVDPGTDYRDALAALTELLAVDNEERRLAALDMLDVSFELTPPELLPQVPQRIASDPARLRLLRDALLAATRAGSGLELHVFGAIFMRGLTADTDVGIAEAARLLATTVQLDQLDLVALARMLVTPDPLHPQKVVTDAIKGLSTATAAHIVVRLEGLGLLGVVRGGPGGGGTWHVTAHARDVGDLLALASEHLLALEAGDGQGATDEAAT